MVNILLFTGFIHPRWLLGISSINSTTPNPESLGLYGRMVWVPANMGVPGSHVLGYSLWRFMKFPVVHHVSGDGDVTSR